MAEQEKQHRIMVVAGETSGDLHGANMIRAVRVQNPQVSFFGVGGPLMLQAGCDLVFPAEELEVMGVVDVIGHLPGLWRAFKRLKKLLYGEDRPDLLVLIDFQEFNQLLARQAKRAGVPVLFYIGPTVWAWRQGRVKTMARVVDRLAVIFPFEPAYYENEDLIVEYVGHPLLDETSPPRRRDEFLGQLGLASERQVVGLFPGSRRSELTYNLPTILETAERLRQKIPGIQFLLPVAPAFSLETVGRKLAAHGLPITLTQEPIYDVAKACDAVLAVSGTVTLQVALVGTPMVIMYKTAPFNFIIGRRLVKTEYIGLPNIVVGRKVVPEYVQQQATACNLAGELVRLLEDQEYRQSMNSQLLKVRDEMGLPGCAERVARMVLEMVQKPLKKEKD